MNNEEKENRIAQVEQIMTQAEQNSSKATEADRRMLQADRLMLQAEQQDRESQIQELNRATQERGNVIGLEQINHAREILQEYKQGKSLADQIIVENDLWYNNKIRPPKGQIEVDRIYQSSWLFNVLSNKHADFMDNYPEATVLPREIGDKDTAQMLSSIIPVVFEQNKFKKVYDKNTWAKVKYGTAVYGVFYDHNALNGLGDIAIRKANVLNLFWAPGIENIQDSPNLFVVSIEDNINLELQFPQLRGKLGATAENETKKFILDDNISTKDKSTVIEWYYKKPNSQGKTVLHYVKFCGDEVLYATENETQITSDGQGNILAEPPAVKGLYDHGKYPYVLDVLFPQENRPTGIGYIDKLKDSQEQVDILNNAILINAKQSATKRWIVSNDTKLNMKEFTDWTNPIIHTVDGSFNENTATEVTTAEMSDVVVATLDRKIDELKETGSNRDFSNGSTASGVTSGAAIAALQEAGNKTSRDMINGSYGAYEEITELVIELIRQFYNTERCFRITGKNGGQEYVNFSNSGMQAQPQLDYFGRTIGERLPIFDIKIKAHKQNPFSRVANNQDMLNFYSMGFFNPQNADQTLACLEMMDIENKDKIVERIQQNGTMYQQLQQIQAVVVPMAQELDRLKGTNYTEQLAQMGLLGMNANNLTGQAKLSSMSSTGEMNEDSGHHTVDKAKEDAQSAAEIK